MSDPYLKMVDEHWDGITMMYETFEQKRPIIELDVVRQQILACPAEEYLDGLSDRTREQTRRSYRRAVDRNAMMVFVRDRSRQVLRSYIFPPAGDDA
ncbi:MAG: hypothetical protein GY722_12465 [bacterium]|nr:hypothetical protein [bacterium]